MNGNDVIQFEIKSYIGKICQYQTGWSKELNIVAWNGGVPKYDIRDWSGDHERMTRGITLHEVEARALFELLKKHFEEV